MNTDKPNILIIDDSKSVLKKIEELLEGFHINLIKSTSAQEALQILLNKEIAIIVSDVNMPNQTGFEFAKTIRNDSNLKNIPLIFISGDYTDQISQNLGLELGALDYILKTQLEDILPKKIRNLLEFIRFQSNLNYDVNNLDVLLKKECAETCELFKDSIASSLLKNRMLIILSNQIRSPLNSIVQYTELLRLSKLQKSQVLNEEVFAQIKKSIVNINDLLENNTLILKAINNNIICDYSDRNLFNFFSEIIHEISESYPDTNIGVKLKNISDIEYIIDSYHLKIVFENLLINAIIHSYESKEVTVLIEIENFNLNISIQDFGIGIPKNLFYTTFDPFMGVDNISNIKGSGIGIAIVKNIIIALKGEINFESTINLGNIINIKIPLRLKNHV